MWGFIDKVLDRMKSGDSGGVFGGGSSSSSSSSSAAESTRSARKRRQRSDESLQSQGSGVSGDGHDDGSLAFEAESDGHAFLLSVGLGRFWPSFEQKAMVSVDDICDSSLVSDVDLVREMGFNAVQVRTFRSAVTSRLNRHHRHRPLNQAATKTVAAALAEAQDQRKDLLGRRVGEDLRATMAQAEKKRQVAVSRVLEQQRQERKQALKVLEEREDKRRAEARRRSDEAARDKAKGRKNAQELKAEQAHLQHDALDSLFGTAATAVAGTSSPLKQVEEGKTKGRFNDNGDGYDSDENEDDGDDDEDTASGALRGVAV